MKTFTNQAAQGDVLLRRIDKLPAGVKLSAAERGQFIVAHSETGHHHVIAERPNVRYYTSDDPLVSYLEVIEATDEMEATIARAKAGGGEVLLEHLRPFDTHETIAVPPGIFELRRQRENAPEGWRMAAD